jgi:hypothetical protein
MSSKGLKPGVKAPQSGIYQPSNGGTQVAISGGDRVPPTDKGGTFKLVIPTKKK